MRQDGGTEEGVREKEVRREGRRIREQKTPAIPVGKKDGNPASQKRDRVKGSPENQHSIVESSP